MIFLNFLLSLPLGFINNLYLYGYEVANANCAQTNLILKIKTLNRKNNLEILFVPLDLENHRLEFHTLRLCSQCQVNVEAYKLPEHMVRIQKWSNNIFRPEKQDILTTKQNEIIY